MVFHPGDVPGELTHGRFRLEPLTPAHVELDYEAVMASRSMLRRWSGTSWPADDFTLEENLADLQMHDREHRRGEAFTYTVLDPEGGACLGCVYITPLARLAEVDPEIPAGPHDAVVRWWIRSDLHRTASDRPLVEALEEWLGSAWKFDRVLFSSRSELGEQLDLMAGCGLVEIARGRFPHRAGEFVLFGES